MTRPKLPLKFDTLQDGCPAILDADDRVVALMECGYFSSDSIVANGKLFAASQELADAVYAVRDYEISAEIYSAQADCGGGTTVETTRTSDLYNNAMAKVENSLIKAGKLNDCRQSSPK